MEVSIAENKRQHAHLGNVSFLVADVTELNQVRLLFARMPQARCLSVAGEPCLGHSLQPR
jgi:hypothetical protein